MVLSDFFFFFKSVLAQEPRLSSVSALPHSSHPRLRCPRRQTSLRKPALSPVRGCYEAVCCLSERSLAIARGRGKSPSTEEPLSLLDDMNHCYSRLRELVPGVPRGTQLSQVEILQRVIDYILDLQVVLAEPAPGPPDGPHLPIQTAELTPELVISKDKRSFCH